LELNKWYQSTFLGQRRGEFFGSFCRFVLEKKGWCSSSSYLNTITTEDIWNNTKNHHFIISKPFGVGKHHTMDPIME
jgi:hypothetical protein